MLLASSVILALTHPPLFNSLALKGTSVLFLDQLLFKQPVLLDIMEPCNVPHLKLKVAHFVLLVTSVPLPLKIIFGIHAPLITIALEGPLVRPTVPPTLTSRDSKQEQNMNVYTTLRAISWLIMSQISVPLAITVLGSRQSRSVLMALITTTKVLFPSTAVLLVLLATSAHRELFQGLHLLSNTCLIMEQLLPMSTECLLDQAT